MTEVKSKIGQIVWQDLTVPNATEVRDFYTKVVGWTATDHDMGDYVDYNILSESGEVVAGICNARDTNACIPPQWLVYIQVEDVESCARRCTELGGKVIDGPRAMGASKFCVIQDPAGAVCGLIGS